MEKYEDVKRLSEKAYEFLIQFDAEKYPDGRVELGDGMYANISTKTTRLRNECEFEAHRKYADLQMMICGQEIITVAPLEQLKGTETSAYNEQSDIIFYKNNAIGIDHIIRNGEYLLLMPEDGHIPSVCVNSQRKIRKMVIKIPVTEQN